MSSQTGEVPHNEFREPCWWPSIGLHSILVLGDIDRSRGSFGSLGISYELTWYIYQICSPVMIYRNLLPSNWSICGLLSTSISDHSDQEPRIPIKIKLKEKSFICSESLDEPQQHREGPALMFRVRLLQGGIQQPDSGVPGRPAS